MGNAEKINNIEKQIKHLETEMTSIQEKCTHKETRVKFKDGTNNMRV